MKKRLFILDVVIASVLGTLLQFIYDWTGQNSVAAIFGAVNESVWEHLKLLFWPVALLTIVEYFLYFKDSKNFILSRFIGLFVGIMTIVTVFYTVFGILGRDLAWFNILLYYIAVFVTFITSRVLRKNGELSFRYSNAIGAVLFIILAIIFGIFSFNPPENVGIFKEPLSCIFSQK